MQRRGGGSPAARLYRTGSGTPSAIRAVSCQPDGSGRRPAPYPFGRNRAGPSPSGRLFALAGSSGAIRGPLVMGDGPALFRAVRAGASPEDTPSRTPLATPDRSRRSSVPAVGSDAAIMREGRGVGIR